LPLVLGSLSYWPEFSKEEKKKRQGCSRTISIFLLNEAIELTVNKIHFSLVLLSLARQGASIGFGGGVANRFLSLSPTIRQRTDRAAVKPALPLFFFQTNIEYSYIPRVKTQITKSLTFPPFPSSKS